LSTVALSGTGELWSYTVVRHRPPGDCRLPEPVEPFAVGLVELAEGLRIVAPLAIDLNRLRIGMALELEAFRLYDTDDGCQVMGFRYRERAVSGAPS
jgi:uncharacterized OB-fold protein